ncbi:MAG TPA: DUF1638 domain-containing protein [Rhodocyclaceae bacterium]
MNGVDAPMVLVGCGILRKEVDALIRKNDWVVETRYLDSSLHNYFDRLYGELDAGLAAEARAGRHPVAFYGACHPRIEGLLDRHRTCRTPGQNCIVMLLGYETFMAELGQGAYFLLEDWALTWEPMLTECFGTNREVLREIFHGSHEYMLALRTPCSGDFSEAAAAAARVVDLPLRWRDVTLDHLEGVLAEVLGPKAETRGE